MQSRNVAPSAPPLAAGLWRMLARAAVKRCPLCGRKGLFSVWTKMLSACPGCGYAYEREEGYWVGAIIVNTAVAEAVFGLLFIGTLFATLPDVPWVPLLVIALVTNGLLPIAFYPNSKTIWVALDLHFHPSKGQRRRFGNR
jgi:uncharacterized protein (DUF983 family)